MPKWPAPNLLICLALALGTALLYVPSLSNDFLRFDDPLYVTDNPTVQQGLTLESVKWAFTTSHFANWLPITWLSHMLDVELFGLNPRGHHATNILIHAINAALVYAVVFSLTRRRAASVAVAVLFAVHPLRVESVAWIAERKDVLCATFFLLMLRAYVWYVRSPRLARLAVVCVLFALGLMSKTMIVTAPCLLLLLDWWPLRRLRVFAPRENDPAGQIKAADGGAASQAASWKRVLLEKVPLVLLAVIASGWTVVLQREGGTMRDLAELTFPQRAANALVSVWRYIGKIVLPVDLSAFYPHPGWWPLWQVVAAAVLLVVVTAAAFAVARRLPYLLVGWLWFLGMLVPVVGLVQVGSQSMADRYTYLPGIGLAIAGVWLIRDVGQSLSLVRRIAPAACALVACLLATITYVQQSYWRSELDLFAHALNLDPDNWMAHDHLGSAFLATEGNDELAIVHYRRAVQLKPTNTTSRTGLATALMRMNRPGEAIVELRELVRHQPDPRNAGPAHVALGAVLAANRQFDEAEAEFALASQLNSPDAELYAQWGLCLLKQGKRDAAAAQAERALAMSPAHQLAKAVLTAARSPNAPGTRPVPAPPAR